MFSGAVPSRRVNSFLAFAYYFLLRIDPVLVLQGPFLSLRPLPELIFFGVADLA